MRAVSGKLGVAGETVETFEYGNKITTTIWKAEEGSYLDWNFEMPFHDWEARDPAGLGDYQPKRPWNFFAEDYECSLEFSEGSFVIREN